MNKLREAAQMALTILDGGADICPASMEHKALRAALAQGRIEAEDAQPEPVAYQWLRSSVIRKRIPKTAEADAWQPLYEARVAIPLYHQPLINEIEKIIRDNTDGDGMCAADDLLAAIRAKGNT